MAHQRTLIRRAAVAALVGNTAAEERVYPTRKVPYRGKELPVIAVYTDDEESQDADRAPRELDRNVDLSVEAWVATSGDPEPNVDDAMDDIALEIEAALHADLHLGNLLDDPGLELTGTSTDLVTVGDLEIGLVVLTFNARYNTLAPQPAADDTLADFRELDQDYSLAGAQAPLDQASDFIEIPREEP